MGSLHVSAVSVSAEVSLRADDANTHKTILDDAGSTFSKIFSSLMVEAKIFPHFLFTDF